MESKPFDAPVSNDHDRDPMRWHRAQLKGSRLFKRNNTILTTQY